jgi:hypothetical protein
MRALFGAGTEEEDGGRVRRAGRPATEHKGQVDGSAGATPTAMPVHESQRGVVLAVSVCSIAVYVRALAFHAGGGCGLLESGQRHARVLQMAVKSPQNLVVGCFILYRHGLNTRRAGSLPSVP